ncbi:hypothetical protein Droror1_Dr00006516 [Drosera rotundifolia]
MAVALSSTIHWHSLRRNGHWCCSCTKRRWGRGLVFDKKVSHAAGGPTKMENENIGVIQFQIFPSKTYIKHNIVVSDYSHMVSFSMDNQSGVQCSENKSLVEHMKNKIEELGRCPKGFSDNKSMAFKRLILVSLDAKYMLSDEGRKAAHDCLLRSNMEALDAAAGMVEKLL